MAWTPMAVASAFYRFADQGDIVGFFQELAPMKLADERLADLAAGKLEAFRVAAVRKAGRLKPVGG